MNVAEAARLMRVDTPPVAIASIDIGGYSIDSRTARAGDLFFALRGENHDGHDHVGPALERGAVAAVVEREIAGASPDRQVRVSDSLEALQQLAKNLLIEWGGPIVGVTGSAGKTTTKDLTARVLSAAGPTHKSLGNLNNAYGLPKSVLEMATDGHTPSDYRFCVLEMGMSTPGEIKRLTEIAPPTVGVVTIVAPVHTEFFEDGIEGVAEAKAELIDGLKPGGTAVLNADDPRVARMRDRRDDITALTYGFADTADVRASNLEAEGLSGSRFRVDTPAGSADVHLPLVGRHNVGNALAAIAAGLALDVPLDAAVDALADAEPSTMRGQVVRLANGVTILDDSYNSSPKAFEAMVTALSGIADAKRRIVVAGEMLELGAESSEMHAACGRVVAAAGINLLAGVRGDARTLVDAARDAGMGDRAVFVDTPEGAAEWLAAELRDGDVVLVKGSRGVATDRVVAALVERFGTGGTN
ncbi:MAG: UDP-N-acetylmuramoyl-tripeptide--D-alanyl-D-alanine ligase [Blastocatellia bacterium]|nr:UDP-N-acetylmuramoyl-tripeptide--D-alanyl-D-alanine ligase [Blastocatellia bacterium]